MNASGGNPEVILRAAPGAPPPAAPQVLPGGRAVIYYDLAGSDPLTNSIKLLELPGGAVKDLVKGGRAPRYVSSGHLTFTRLGTMLAVPFDLQRLDGRRSGARSKASLQTSLRRRDRGGVRERLAAYVPGPLAIRGRFRSSLTKAGGLTPFAHAFHLVFPAFFTGWPSRGDDDFRRPSKRHLVYDIARDILTRVTADPVERS